MNQHRRDLNTNELEKIVTKATPFLEEHGNKLIYGMCAALLIFAVCFYLFKTNTNTESAGWAAFVNSSMTNSAEDFSKVANKYGKEDVGSWALLNQAELTLNQGVRTTFSDREGAISDLKDAQEKFESLLKKPNLPDKVEERGLFGLARTLETLWDGTGDQPIKAYQEFEKRFPDSVYAPIAKERVESLSSPEGKQFYVWFQKQDPKPADRRTPQDGFQGQQPGVDPGSLIGLPPVPEMLQLPEATSPAFPDDPAGATDSSATPDAPPLPEEAEKTGTAPPLPE